jgi:hypothetical protein
MTNYQQFYSTYRKKKHTHTISNFTVDVGIQNINSDRRKMAIMFSIGKKIGQNKNIKKGFKL